MVLSEFKDGAVVTEGSFALLIDLIKYLHEQNPALYAPATPAELINAILTSVKVRPYVFKERREELRITVYMAGSRFEKMRVWGDRAIAGGGGFDIIADELTVLITEGLNHKNDGIVIPSYVWEVKVNGYMANKTGRVETLLIPGDYSDVRQYVMGWMNAEHSLTGYYIRTVKNEYRVDEEIHIGKDIGALSTARIIGYRFVNEDGSLSNRCGVV